MDYFGLVDTIEKLLEQRDVSKLLTTFAIIENTVSHENKNELYSQIEMKFSERNLGKIEFAIDMVENRPQYSDNFHPMELLVKISGLDIPDWKEMPPDQLMMRLYEDDHIREMMEFTTEVFQMCGHSPYDRFR